MAYFARRTPEGLSLWRMRTIPDRSLYTFGRLNLIPHDAPLNLDDWRRLAESERSRNSSKSFSAYNSTIASTPASCVESIPTQDQSNESLVCKAADSTTAFYVGDHRGIAEVKQILNTALLNSEGGPQ
jgi:hypothetical protein